MFDNSPPPQHATHRSSLLEGAVAEASATIALVQIRNGLKALRWKHRPPNPAAVANHIEQNLQILERCLAVQICAATAPDPRQLGLFSGKGVQ